MQFDETVTLPSTTTPITTTVPTDVCEDMTEEECAQSTSLGCVWFPDESTATAPLTTTAPPVTLTSGVCVCTTSGGCSNADETIVSPTNSGAYSTTEHGSTSSIAAPSMTVAANGTGDLCVALDHVTLRETPCGNTTTTTTLLRNDRVSLVSNISAECNGTVLFHVRHESDQGYAPLTAFTSDCDNRYIVDEENSGDDATLVYIIVGAVGGTLAVVGLALTTGFCVARRRTRLNSQPPALRGPYDQIPSIPARVSQYSELSGTEIEGKS
jgi:hypothetical protein